MIDFHRQYVKSSPNFPQFGFRELHDQAMGHPEQAVCEGGGGGGGECHGVSRRLGRVSSHLVLRHDWGEVVWRMKGKAGSPYERFQRWRLEHLSASSW